MKGVSFALVEQVSRRSDGRSLDKPNISMVLIRAGGRTVSVDQSCPDEVDACYCRRDAYSQLCLEPFQPNFYRRSSSRPSPVCFGDCLITVAAAAILIMQAGAHVCSLCHVEW